MTVTPFERQVEGDFRRNVGAFVLFEFLWGLGMPFCSYLTMAIGYMAAIHAPNILIGFVQSLWTTTTPLQLLSAHLFLRRRRLGNVVALFCTGIISWLAYDVAVLFLFPRASQALLVGGLVLALTSFVVCLSLAQPLYTSILTDNIPLRKRGRIFGLRTLGFGAAAVLVGSLASKLLRRWGSPRNYQVSLLVGNLLWLLPVAGLFLIKDHMDPQRQSVRRKLLPSVERRIVILWANPNYRTFLFFHLLNVCATTIGVFVIPFARQRLGVSAQQVSILTVIYLGCSAALGMPIGKLADRYGYKAIGLLQSVCLCTVFLISIRAGSFRWICVAYAFYSIPSISLLVVLANMSVELCPKMDAGDLVAIGSTMMLPVVAVVAPLCGAIVDLSGTYLPIFSVGLTISVVALLGIMFLVREPRTGRMYVVKRLPRR